VTSRAPARPRASSGCRSASNAAAEQHSRPRRRAAL
jgi:hypothetical protein